MLRLVVYAPGGVQRFAVPSSPATLGSDPACELRLPYAGVAPQHARVSWTAAGLIIEDLGARRGVLLNGKRVRHATLGVWDEIRLGTLALIVEDAGVSPPPGAGGPAVQVENVEEGSTGVDPSVNEPLRPEALLHSLSRFSGWVLADVESQGTAEAQLAEVLRAFGGGALFLLRVDVEPPLVRLAVATDRRWYGAAESLLGQIAHDAQAGRGEQGSTGADRAVMEGRPTWLFHRRVRGFGRQHMLLVALPEFAGGEWCEHGFATLADLLVLGLVHHVGRYEPLIPGSRNQKALRLAPGFLVGDSPTVRKLTDVLASAAANDVALCLRGESGTGRREWARSVHLSSARAVRPFVTLACGGGSAVQLEAELFGASIPGRAGVLERPGKLADARGGTMYLEEVDQLPMEVQGRLARWLRESDADSDQSQIPRLVCSTTVALDEAAAHDRFRADLAYRLTRLTIEVPALRDRREELPLLIQGLVNRFCHETGKRVQGITVDALAALTRYRYPGNFPEFENIVRQMVYLCGSDQPITSNLLPERLRSLESAVAQSLEAALPASGNGTEGPTLGALVASCEEAAIREALRRSLGNKARAAKRLGLSRNGLALKMNRYGISLPGRHA